MQSNSGFDTQAVHAGTEEKNPWGAVNPPIFMTSSFEYDSLEHSEAIFTGKAPGYVYTRGNNPTLKIFEQKMAALEQGSDAVAFASGMAAISSVLLSLVQTGDEIIASRTLYGSAFGLMNRLLPRLGIKTHFVDLSNPENVKPYLNDKTRIIYFETPCNPSLSLIDIKKISEIAKNAERDFAHQSRPKFHGVKVVVDNTFATPFLQNPLVLGADVVVHSATKYIGGHGDSVGGIAISKDYDYLQYLKFEYMCDLGGVLSPMNGWLFIRGLKTLSARMERHERNAVAIAKYLENHTKIECVYYPGLKSHPQHALAREQMRGFGGIVSFEVKGGYDKAAALMNHFDLFSLAVSLGDTESLIEHPASMTHRDYPRETLSNFGFSDKLVRISAGLETTEDLISDLEKALSKI